MGIKLPSISVSKYTVLIAAQLVVNAWLAVWLYDEYLHNPFMQIYMSAIWSAIWPETALAVGIAAGAIATLVAYRRGHLSKIIEGSMRNAGATPLGASATLAAIDMCPFCESPLKTLSEGRLQCRNCRRYFKSSMPKVAA